MQSCIQRSSLCCTGPLPGALTTPIHARLSWLLSFPSSPCSTCALHLSPSSDLPPMQANALPHHTTPRTLRRTLKLTLSSLTLAFTLTLFLSLALTLTLPHTDSPVLRNALSHSHSHAHSFIHSLSHAPETHSLSCTLAVTLTLCARAQGKGLQCGCSEKVRISVRGPG